MNLNEYISWQFRQQIDKILPEIDRLADDTDYDPARKCCPADNVRQMIEQLNADYAAYHAGDREKSKLLRLYDKFGEEVHRKTFPKPLYVTHINLN